jgi:hypothetical protein
MGAGLNDGVREGDVTESEFRTPPLCGVGRTGPPYLHDGRASTLTDAIRAHGGEAESAAKRFETLSASDQPGRDRISQVAVTSPILSSARRRTLGPTAHGDVLGWPVSFTFASCEMSILEVNV